MTCSPARGRLRILAVAAGGLFVAAGGAAWTAVTTQLRHEDITVPPNADLLPGRRVLGPLSAYAQAEVIKRNAERGTGGRTFADISAALRGVDGDSDEARELRGHSASLATAASLRTSLMTSVLAYGVSALVAGLGTVFLVAGAQLNRKR
ncbi:aromatic ring-opening dioxygenase LigA [Microbacterium sp.]|uniref:aromatic ring-opening dioxygenase LigA n=1 Tax=Microbacterium sp. TaxID=51671 RepID=UPI003A87D052